ncbi:hypothetical protein [Sutcliffiella horikoshii]|uniref:Uncharacterized protein n=1 Tax=Sutcliffiella horikoshii TaxID=79883 RepID=A0A5D4TGV7_9BACI|nr:hypothetical protein [Sutcliffiella horikoshii]TYS74505.1 hypothetical protein FZC75_02065 [Sutcliffiella horikoshii]
MKKNLDITKGCYIPSIEAEEIYDMSVRGLENIMKYEYSGQIPYSLELIKLRSYSRLFGEKEITKNNKIKYLSDALINIRFKNKVKNGQEITSNVRGYDNLMTRLRNQFRATNKAKRENLKLIQSLKNKREIEKVKKQVSYLENKARLILEHINKAIVNKDNEIYKSKKAPELRKYLYVNPFTFKGREYVFYKRTASKSRQSNTLFILKELHEKMKEWSHMGLDLSGKIDVGSLLAYESLVSSSIESTIEIDTKKILIIDDKFSVFKRPAIEVGSELTATPNKESKIENNIWDGQGLVDISLMESIGKGDKGMILTRQHFWKSCLFNTNIQQFLRDNCPEDIEYSEWKIPDAFGNTPYAKDILVISTPSSCKFMKYAAKGKEKEAYSNWCKRVKKDKNIFGICKHEKPSKHGDYSFSSYQMINTLDIEDVSEIEELAKFEVEYIKSLQGIETENGSYDEGPFIKYLEEKKDISNAYEMLAELYKITPEIVRTKMFRDYRKKQVSNYRTKVKGGKLRLQADYLTVVSNPYEMLLAVIGQFNEVKTHTLEGNQVYTPFASTGEYYVARNPHNAMHNWFKVDVVENNLMSKYFNFTPNIIAISSIDNEAMDRLNGMDMDSDTILFFKCKYINSIIEKTLANRNYPIIRNTIKSTPNPVELTNSNISDVDERTAKSQRWIGQITNAAQYQVSLLWDIQNGKEKVDKKTIISEILDNLAVLVVLSNVAIDYAKKAVPIEIDEALRLIRKSEVGKEIVEVKNKKGKIVEKSYARKKPNFWKYVTSSDTETENYNCPMDKLISHINSIEKAGYRKNVSINSLITKGEMKGSDDKQIQDVISAIQKFNYDIKTINATEDECKENQERLIRLEDAYISLDAKISKKVIRQSTMRKIVEMVAKTYDKQKGNAKTDKLSGITIHLLNTLYRNHKETFLNVFKNDR